MTTARRRQTRAQPEPKGADTDYRGELWRMADALRGSMDANEYKHVVLGLIFLKYISDAFEEAYTTLESERDQGADPEDPDEYRAQSIFWVPPEAPVAASPEPSPPAHHRPLGGRRHDGG